jgi:hypothetical protein
MKAILLILVLGLVSYAQAQGVEFLVDNILSPLIDGVGSNLQTFVLGNLGSWAGQLGGLFDSFFYLMKSI